MTTGQTQVGRINEIAQNLLKVSNFPQPKMFVLFGLVLFNSKAILFNITKTSITLKLP